MKVRRAVAGSGLFLVVALAILAAFSRLPSLDNRTISTSAIDARATKLGRAIAPLLAQHPGLSGIYPLTDARDAFAARNCLALATERTLDVQYYIWRNDLSGTLLFKALHDAAERGVRVRLLLDDNNTSGLDRVLAALDAHPLIEVRLFNPFVIRRVRAVGFLTDFSRLNRRMHNKSFIGDGQVAIVGGRNVGDEYFGATDGVLFTDVDVMAIGPAVREASADFDRYWASGSSYPLDRLLPPANEQQVAEVRDAARRLERAPAAVAYVSAIRASPFVRDLMAGTLSMVWAPTQLISDDPAKGLGRVRAEDLLVERMKNVFGTPRRKVDLISPYFVPGEDGTRLFAGWAKRGVKIRVLTNSLEATDVAAVHAGYAKRREALLEAGVTLFELRRRVGEQRGGSSGTFGSSAASLHAKTFAVDDARLFVGSFNFDPRSTELNTEMGFVIDSTVLARRITEAFDRRIPERSYEVRKSDAGDVYWIERRDGVLRRREKEPGATFWRTAWISLLARLPIEWLL
ncbi:MAG TPA: phospholipase D family protein [Thermoanaerobaculia bacterium]|jgi:putative cardiolipin synthase|nr:phospholipase D family protein [Thermoanaerobaculia bacterium]